MKLKELNAKQFLLEKGERVGLGAALGLAVLLLLSSLFLPGNGFFSGSPAEKARALAATTQQVQNGLNTNQPGEADMPLAGARDKIKAFEIAQVKAQPFQVANLFPVGGPGDIRRRPPEVLAVDEAYAQVLRVQVKSYIFGREGRNPVVYALEGAPAGQGGGQDMRRMAASFGRRGGRGGPPGMMPAQPPMRPGGPGSGGSMASRGLNNLSGVPGLAPTEMVKQDYKVVPVPIDKLTTSQKDRKLAVQVRPLRMAIIAASFPYKAQLEEFRDKLRLGSVPEVLMEASREKSPDGQPLPAFRFLGVEVQRRTVGFDGKPTAWETLDLERSYKPFFVLTATEREPESAKFFPVLFPGLVMPRLPQFRPDEMAAASAMAAPGGEGPMSGAVATAAARPEHDQYKDSPEDKLDNLAKTLRELANKAAGQIAKPPSIFNTDKFDIFGVGGPGPDATGMAGPPGTSANPMRREGMAPMPPMGPGGVGLYTQEMTTPDHCLVRLIDVTIEPGKTYQYRLRVRMANPNFDRPDVASPTYSEGKELHSEKWFEVKQNVEVPPELLYYAVDQLELDGRSYKGINARYQLNRDKQTVFQIHRWVETAPNGNSRSNPFIIGEWAVAERVPVFRGEYVGQNVRVEIPIWRFNREEFVIASDSGTKRRAPGIPIPFGSDRPDGLETLLVDFEGGRQSYEKVVKRDEDMVKTERLTDSSGTEVLLLSPDGRLLAHNSSDDVPDKTRKDRLKEVRERIKDVKEKKVGGSRPGGGTAPSFTNPGT